MQVAAEKAASGQEELPDEDLSGFNFKLLVERKPELKQELLGFRDYLLASSSADESLKASLLPFLHHSPWCPTWLWSFCNEPAWP